MLVAHIGANTARQGGPAGYLSQLRRAIDAYGTDDIDLMLPTPISDPGGPPRAVAPHPMLQQLRRLRRHVVGAPAVYRPSPEGLARERGPAHDMMLGAWCDMQVSGRASLDTAIRANADVLFTHDPASAELALDRRHDGQQVWLFMHTPMSLALYLTWCWGVPEARWADIAALPDVKQWTAREIAAVEAVDAVMVPCPEAVDELVRSDGRFAAALERAKFLLTGAAAPERVWPDASRPELRQRLGLPLDVPCVLFLGSAQAYRGLDALLNAVTRLPSPKALPGVVAIAGPAVETLPLSRRIRALGPVREVADVLAAVDAVINVNRFSLFDLSTIEALQAGCPLIMHATGGNNTFNRLGAGTLMMPALDADTIAAALERVFAMSASERNELGRRSRDCYDRHTTLRHLRDRHVEAYTRPFSPARPV